MSTRKKIILVGDVECGKTCLLMAFRNDMFMPEYQSTLFEAIVVEMEIDSLKVREKNTRQEVNTII